MVTGSVLPGTFRPLPDVSRHIEEAVAIGRKGSQRFLSFCEQMAFVVLIVHFFVSLFTAKTIAHKWDPCSRISPARSSWRRVAPNFVMTSAQANDSRPGPDVARSQAGGDGSAWSGPC